MYMYMVMNIVICVLIVEIFRTWFNVVQLYIMLCGFLIDAN